MASSAAGALRPRLALGKNVNHQRRRRSSRRRRSASLQVRIHPLPPKAASNALNLRYRDFLTVALMIRSKDNLPRQLDLHPRFQGQGRPHPELPQTWSPEMVPDPSLACVELEYFCFEGDGLWASSDEELIALAKRGNGDPWPLRSLLTSRGRSGGSPGKSLPSLRRPLSRQCRSDPRRLREPLIQRFTWSGATACTATITRTMR